VLGRQPKRVKLTATNYFKVHAEVPLGFPNIQGNVPQRCKDTRVRPRVVSYIFPFSGTGIDAYTLASRILVWLRSELPKEAPVQLSVFAPCAYLDVPHVGQWRKYNKREVLDD
jgi:hypothetical protein